MVSQSLNGMSAPCSEFTQNAWRKELCINCQRSKGEHSSVKSSPVPAKRTSVHLKTSATPSSAPGKPARLKVDGVADDWPVNDGEWCVIDNKNSSQLTNSQSSESSNRKDVEGELTESIEILKPDEENKMVLKKSKVSFMTSDPEVIGDDGGWDNLTEDDFAHSESDSSSEEIVFTEEEKTFLLTALENTLWNSDKENLLQKTVNSVRKNSCKEYEDVKLSSLWNSDRFASVRDCDKLITRRYGTFPLRNKSSKMSLENVFQDKTARGMSSSVHLQSITENDTDLDPNKKLCSDPGLSTGLYDEPGEIFFTSVRDREKILKEKEISQAVPYKVVSVDDILNPGSTFGPELPKKVGSKSEDKTSERKRSSESDPSDETACNQYGDNVLADDTDLFATYNPSIDLESSSAEMALVDLLNNVLAKYSDSDSFKGIESHELLPEVTKDELQSAVDGSIESAEKIVSIDSKLPKGSIKSKAFEAKLARMAASLDLSKQKTKKPAPKPPSSPPPPEPSQVKPNTQNLNEPNFKMVPIGKSIIDYGQDQKPLSPKRNYDFQTEIPDSSKAPPAGKSDAKSNKRGITSFFRSMWRRGRDSTESVNEPESSSADSVASKSPQTSNAQSSCSSTESVGTPEQSTNRKEGIGNSSPVLKMKVLPTVTKPTRTSVVMTTAENGKKAKNSPEMPRAVKGSPKVSKKSKDIPSKITETVEEEEKSKVTEKKVPEKEIPSIPTKPPVAARPKPSLPSKPPPAAPQKPQLTSQGSSASLKVDEGKTQEVKDKESKVKDRDVSTKERSASIGSHDGGSSATAVESKTQDSPKLDSKREPHVQVRKRPKSPKRGPAPSRPSLPTTAPGKSHESRNTLFTKELEMKISKGLDQGKSISSSEKTSKSAAEKSVKVAKPTADPKKALAPQPPSPTSPTEMVFSTSGTTPSTDTTTDVKGDKQDIMSQSLTSESASVLASSTSAAEKIELPNKAQSRKSFLGKLGNRKSRAPPRPPSIVKRTKSITENTLPGAEGHVKKCDISSPVLITDMTSSAVVNRRNTIALGAEDCSAVSGGSTSSGSTNNDKYDEWPEFSPFGSADNLYEPIVPKEPPPPPPNGNVYDPITSAHNNQTSNANMQPPMEGYLEPVRSNANLEAQGQGQVQLPQEVSPADSSRQGGNDVSEERRVLLASQPIYEEINGYNKDLSASLKDNNISDLSPPPKLVVDTTLLPSDKETPTAVSPSPSIESESSSASSTLNRPKPIPRKRPKKTESSGSEQPYVAMNRPSIAVSLNESELRDVLNQLTSMNLQTMREIYTQYEKVFTKETVNLNITGAGPIKWRDFDIYGKPVHTSERCIVYNAKLKSTSSHCQLLLLHTRPDLTSVQHPSLLKPTVVFTDNIPHSYLTEDFLKTNQLLQNLQNSVSQSNLAKCYIAIGLFDITGNLNHKLVSLQGNFSSNSANHEEDFHTLLFYVLQLLSAISHCLDQGCTLGESNFRDVFIVANSNHSCGDIIAFLPHQRSHDTSQVESIFGLLENYFLDTLAEVSQEDFDKQFLCVNTIQRMLQSRKIESLAMVRNYVEYLLWGPKGEKWQSGKERESNIEPRLSMWLEKERAALIHKFANTPVGDKRTCSVRDFYHMKFLLKSSAVSMSECLRHH